MDHRNNVDNTARFYGAEARVIDTLHNELQKQCRQYDNTAGFYAAEAKVILQAASAI